MTFRDDETVCIICGVNSPSELIRYLEKLAIN